jgi:hypothetical protein
LPMPENRHLEGHISKKVPANPGQMNVCIPALADHPTFRSSRAHPGLQTASETSKMMRESYGTTNSGIADYKASIHVPARVPCNLILKGVRIGGVT